MREHEPKVFKMTRGEQASHKENGAAHNWWRKRRPKELRLTGKNRMQIINKRQELWKNNRRGCWRSEDSAYWTHQLKQNEQILKNEP